MDVAITLSLVSPVRRAAANGPHAVALDLARGLLARGHRATLYAAAGSEVDDVPFVPVPVDPAAAQAAIRPAALEAAANSALRDGFAKLFTLVRGGGHDVVSQHAFDADAFTSSADLPVLHTLHLPPLVPAVVGAARATRAPLAAVSVSSARDWGGAGVRVDHVIRNGVPDHGLRARDPRPVALVAGRISPEKGVADAIGAARGAGLAVEVVGDVYDADYHRREVAPLVRPGEYLGPLPRGELARLMNRAAALVLPVRWDEPFGLVAAEAQMAGCPVVAYARGALPEIVRHGVTGWLVRPDDTHGLTRSLSDLGRFDRAAIRRIARASLGVDAMVEGYVDALSMVVARHAPRPSVGAGLR